MIFAQCFACGRSQSHLTVQLFGEPKGEWVCVRAEASWNPSAGLGVGRADAVPQVCRRGRLASRGKGDKS